MQRKVNGVCSSLQPALLLRELTCHRRCYMPSGRGDIPAFTLAELILDLGNRRDVRLSLPSCLITYRDDIPTRRRSPIPVLTGLDVVTSLIRLTNNATATPRRQPVP